MVNQVVLIGNLGADPEAKTSKTGKTFSTLRVATHAKWKDQATGELREETQWHRVVCWNRLGETCSKYLVKGSMVFISGSIRNYSYEKDGQTKYASEIVAEDVRFLDRKKDGDVDTKEGNNNGTEYKTPF